MERHGTVIQTSEAGARVRLDAEACDTNSGGCGACGGGCGGHGGDGFRGEFEVTVETTRPLHEGDRVRLDVQTPNESLVAFVLFGLPLLFAVGGALAGEALAGADWGLVVGLFLGIAAGFGLAGMADRLVPSLAIRSQLLSDEN